MIDLVHIYLKPPNRGHGIGTNLVNLAIQRAKDRKLPLFVGTEPQVYPFFASFGFKDTGHVDWDLAKHAPAHCGFGSFRLSGMLYEV